MLHMGSQPSYAHGNMCHTARPPSSYPSQHMSQGYEPQPPRHHDAYGRPPPQMAPHPGMYRSSYPPSYAPAPVQMQPMRQMLPMEPMPHMHPMSSMPRMPPMMTKQAPLPDGTVPPPPSSYGMPMQYDYRGYPVSSMDPHREALVPPPSKPGLHSMTPTKPKDQRPNRVGLNYRCGRCGQPKKGHNCSTLPPQMLRARQAMIEATKAAAAAERAAAHVIKSKEGNARRSDGSDGEAAPEVGSKVVSPSPSTTSINANVPYGSPTPATDLASASGDSRPQSPVTPRASAPAPPQTSAGVEAADALSMKLAGQTREEAAAAVAAAAVAAAASRQSQTGDGADAGSETVEEAARRALAHAEIVCVLPSLMQIRSGPTKRERALSPVRSSSPVVNRSASDSSPISGKRLRPPSQRSSEADSEHQDAQGLSSAAVKPSLDEVRSTDEADTADDRDEAGSE